MLAYAANRPDPAGRRSSPNVMLVIVVAHIAAIAALMSAKTDIVRIISDPPLIPVALDPDPPRPQPPRPTQPSPRPSPRDVLTHPTSPVLMPPLPQPPTADPTAVTGGNPGAAIDSVPIPQPPPLPLPLPVRAGPQLLTPASELRPPYPEMKLLNEEEADLRLRLSIGPDGHVTAVDPVGRADAVFLDAARRYLVAHWRYRPAMVDSRPVATTLEITLSFRLDG